MRKIITVTFHCAHNYGAVFQAYALQRYINTNFPNVESACLNYQPDFLKEHLFVKSKTEGYLKAFLHNVITFRSRYKRKSEFDRFIRNNIKTFDRSENLDCLENVFVVGSDQVWNPDITNGTFDSTYFLEGIHNATKASYAASVGRGDEHTHTLIANKINSFDFIGVREEKTQRLLSERVSNKIWLNIDPVFLLEDKCYSDIASQVPYDNYVLVYTLETNDQVKAIINEYKKKYKIVSIGTFRNIYGSDIHYSSASPELYLGLIKGASHVVTNSFHAVAFSIIFKKNIKYIPLQNGRGGRIENLLLIFGINDNEFVAERAEYQRINDVIHSSKEYLERVINYESEKK